MAAWLGLEQYVPAFRANDIDAEVLRRLTADDLRELGITSIGHRRRLLDARRPRFRLTHRGGLDPISAGARRAVTRKMVDGSSISSPFA